MILNSNIGNQAKISDGDKQAVSYSGRMLTADEGGQRTKKDDIRSSISDENCENCESQG